MAAPASDDTLSWRSSPLSRDTRRKPSSAFRPERVGDRLMIGGSSIASRSVPESDRGRMYRMRAANQIRLVRPTREIRALALGAQREYPFRHARTVEQAEA
jgi:hypothetical protein